MITEHQPNPAVSPEGDRERPGGTGAAGENLGPGQDRAGLGRSVAIAARDRVRPDLLAGEQAVAPVALGAITAPPDRTPNPRSASASRDRVTGV